MSLLLKKQQTTTTNPTPKALMKNVDFSEYFCTKLEERVILHVIQQNFLKSLSKHFFFFSWSFRYLPSSSCPNPSLQPLYPFSACISFPPILFLSYLPISSIEQYSTECLKCVPLLISLFFRIHPSNKEYIYIYLVIVVGKLESIF